MAEDSSKYSNTWSGSVSQQSIRYFEESTPFHPLLMIIPILPSAKREYRVNCMYRVRRSKSTNPRNSSRTTLCSPWHYSSTAFPKEAYRQYTRFSLRVIPGQQFHNSAAPQQHHSSIIAASQQHHGKASQQACNSPPYEPSFPRSTFLP